MVAVATSDSVTTTGQTGCLKFVRGPLKSPYQLSPVEGGVFRIRNRYGSIKRDQFSFYGIVAEMSNGDTPSDSDSEEGYETPPEGIYKYIIIITMFV